ncbi:hypothetical protein NC653_014055 [Populus alba x Populus x berolinensis]|uniref:Uncharacterized protein n=1 Tax=Populus alba x Populus x berolinensis TaxID=444605 RepID=A0AAD6QWB1_9ROSI|nr:hypothetical protein NC653_014055 [Populus alba x Populus x berolinensis]
MELPLLLSTSLCSPSPIPLILGLRSILDQFLDGFVLEAYINFSIQSLGVCQIITCSFGGIVFFSGTHFSGKRKGAKIILLLLKINYLFLKS